MSKRLLAPTGGLVISGVALIAVLNTVDLREAATILIRANAWPVAAILGVVALQVLLRAVRWSIVLPARPPVPPSRLVAPMLIGYLGNAVLPARLGEPMRAVVASRRESLDVATTFGSVVLERAIDIVTLAGIALIAATFAGAPIWAIQALAVLVAVGVAAMVLLLAFGAIPIVRVLEHIGLARFPHAHGAMARFAWTLGGRSQRRPMAMAALLSGVAWLLDAGSFFLAGFAVGADLSYAFAALIGGVAILGTAIPSAPGFVGTFEAAAAGMAIALGVPAPQALALAIIAHAMTLIPLALAGSVTLIATGGKLMEIAETAEAGRHG